MILEAWYGPAERDSDSEGLDLNVTIPVQALVNKSQLYIPGRRSKVGLNTVLAFPNFFCWFPFPFADSELTNVSICSRILRTSNAGNILHALVLL